MAAANPLKVEWVSPADILPYGENPRVIPPEAVRAVAASIDEFGWTQPIVVDSDRVIVIGHTRWHAALSLELKKIPIHVASKLTEEQIKALRIADNRTGELTRWNDDILGAEIRALESIGEINLGVLGFADQDLKKFLDGAGVGPDEFPEHGDNIETQHTCPKCGYEWSGSS